MKTEAARAVRLFGQKIREHGMPMKPISAEYTFDGSAVTLNFTAPDRVDFRELARELGSALRCRVELKHVGARDETRLLGGVGRCGRTLCCASWLPVFPDVSMGMAKTQDLPLNPQKVSGVCGRLLCCLSYENEQYRQMKSIMPRLGQPVQTPAGTGMVVAMQLLKELITVRLDADRTDVVYPAHELGFGTPPEPTLAPIVLKPVPAAAPAPAPDDEVAAPSKPSRPAKQKPAPTPAPVVAAATDDESDGEDDGPEEEGGTPEDGAAPKTGRRRRRRRGGRKKPPAEPQA
jgi:cell fate regulator YaaT (PSP1 superfamily)